LKVSRSCFSSRFLKGRASAGGLSFSTEFQALPPKREAMKKSYGIELNEKTVARLKLVFGLKNDREVRKYLQSMVEQELRFHGIIKEE